MKVIIMEVLSMIKKTKWIEAAGIVFLALFFAALAFAQEIETVDGVRIVHNGKTGRWGKTPKISLELIRTLGDINAEDENIAFYMPGDIVFDAQGNWIILDSGNHRIQEFSPDGQFLATIGRQGQGPGEMSFPASLDLDSSGKLVISDPNNQRIQLLTPNGKEFKTIRIPQGAVGVVRVLSSGRLVMGGSAGFIIMGMGEENKNKELPQLMKIIDLDGHILKEFGDQHNYKHLLLNRMGNQVLFTVDSRDHIYLAFPYQNRIEKYSPEGVLLWRADRELDYSMAPPKNKGKREASGGNVSIQAPQMNRCSNGIAVDGQGRIWVITLTRQIKDDEKVNQMISVQMVNGQRSMNMKLKGNTDIEKTDMYKIQIFAPDGMLLGEIPLQHFADSITIQNNKVFLVDKLRGTKYYEYKISQ